MSGELQPTMGDVRPHGHLKMGRFTQHFIDVLDLDLTPLEFFEQTYLSDAREDLRKYLGRFGVSGKMQMQKMAELSDGQKSRVVFAKLGRDVPHILLLDEPYVLLACFCFISTCFLSLELWSGWCERIIDSPSLALFCRLPIGFVWWVCSSGRIIWVSGMHVCTSVRELPRRRTCIGVWLIECRIRSSHTLYYCWSLLRFTLLFGCFAYPRYGVD
jgi:hypothetical protein